MMAASFFPLSGLSGFQRSSAAYTPVFRAVVFGPLPESLGISLNFRDFSIGNAAMQESNHVEKTFLDKDRDVYRVPE